MQVENNGVLSASNHCPDAENHKKRKSLKILLASEEKQMSHELNDEQVRVCVEI